MQTKNDSAIAITITLHKHLPIILIDTSYYVFYRYFATYRWYSFQYKSQGNTEQYVREHEDEFNQSLFTHFDNDIAKLCKKWKTIPSNILFCKDCPRNNIWRTQIYPQYKQSRVAHANFNPEAFPILYEKIDRFQTVFVPALEADDVAYLSHASLRDQGWTNRIIFITNDNDYLQLKDENNEFYNLEGKSKNIFERAGTTPERILITKILHGDKSDNILPVTIPMTKAMLNECLEMNAEELEQWIQDKNAIDRFQLNQQLIDFKCIPEELQIRFHEMYAFSCPT